MVSESNISQSADCRKSCLNPYCLGGWSRRWEDEEPRELILKVLILIVLEDGLGGSKVDIIVQKVAVLILIVLEDGLGVKPL